MMNTCQESNERIKAQDTTKISLITGASRGLGRNTALALAKRVDVIVTHRKQRGRSKMLSLQLKKLAVKLLHYNWILLTPKPLTIL